MVIRGSYFEVRSQNRFTSCQCSPASSIEYIALDCRCYIGVWVPLSRAWPNILKVFPTSRMGDSLIAVLVLLTLYPERDLALEIDIGT